jgi:hypothetical protein
MPSVISPRSSWLALFWHTMTPATPPRVPWGCQIDKNGIGSNAARQSALLQELRVHPETEWS